MLFLARIVAADLCRIHPHLAGRSLLFFGDWEVNPEGRIVAVPEQVAVFPVPTPERPPSAIPSLNECVLEMVESIALPSASDEFENWRYSEALRAFGARSREVWEGCWVTDTALGDLVEEHYGPYSIALPMPHRVFGYPLYTQGHPAEVPEQKFTKHFALSGGASKDEFVRRAGRWVPVLSLVSDDVAGLSFSDTGNCGFLVTEEALAAGMFEDAVFYQDNC